ncbi:MAG: methyltransferase domain-containing protein [Cyanomargarita calcarea GSE-NOS-MK-12-04C]|jgi:2-polyprenyl-3-methyl-5-hydroxy-6-metoxy-1,4-benzoquinol methylase|uniref:Methyltransferase domain-containing protein n=1 Tax=Cyanomargarita calcarea GSE-NOS-MK-12-04C TaxID=2839659 RepID=A0A951UVC5_9CYAN|nr:methyltransferase domain-containing protein [Cyanomargarita calcarea GSE-NOS-MK-12-04C]
MLNQILTKLADDSKSESLSTKLRKRRFAFFNSLLKTLPKPLKILDVGGRENIWLKEGFCNKEVAKNVEITIINFENETNKIAHSNISNIKALIGNATNMEHFADNAFDIVFSNSVIEHVGDYEAQRQMAMEVQRVGKRYFIQTPNRYFPIEPHFLFPFFQFLPLWAKMFLITHFNLGWRPKTTDKAAAKELVTSVKLLTKKELVELFPKAAIFEEKFLGLTKSLIAYDGWEKDSVTQEK